MTVSFTPKKPPSPPKEEGADHVRLGFPLAGVARKTLHLKVAGIYYGFPLVGVAHKTLHLKVVGIYYINLALTLCAAVPTTASP